MDAHVYWPWTNTASPTTSPYYEQDVVDIGSKHRGASTFSDSDSQHEHRSDITFKTLTSACKSWYKAKRCTAGYLNLWVWGLSTREENLRYGFSSFYYSFIRLSKWTTTRFVKCCGLGPQPGAHSPASPRHPSPVHPILVWWPSMSWKILLAASSQVPYLQLPVSYN